MSTLSTEAAEYADFIFAEWWDHYNVSLSTV